MFQFKCYNIRIEFYYWWLTQKNGHKKEPSWSDLEIKYEALKELEKGGPNKDVANQFYTPASTLATWKKNKKNIWRFSKFITETKRVKTGTYEKLTEALLKWFTSVCGNNISVNDPILLQKVIEKDINLSDKKNCIYCSFLACTILYIVKKIPCLVFSKFGPNNLNFYNSKTHVIRTNFESPWRFELHEFNCSL